LTLPTVLPALNHREVGEAARILHAALVGVRDAASRANEPRGLRLLPDPILTVPSLANASTTAYPGTTTLAYNRFVPIEPAPDYNDGFVTFNLPPPLSGLGSLSGFPTTYFNNTSQVYPCYPPGSSGGTVLMIEEAPYVGNNPSMGLNSPTSWFWNVRVGDRIRFGDSGRYYSVVGPLTVNPQSPNYPGQNPELFVNVGPPGTPSPLVRQYTDTNGNYQYPPVDFLYLVNGQDDDGDGYTDDGYDGVDNNGIYGVDDLTEWEPETWLGPQAALMQNIATAGQSQPTKYTIARRPVVNQAASEISLPPNVVIDATSYLRPTTATGGFFINGSPERSRLPIDLYTLYVDILLNPNGQVVPTTQYSNPASFTMSSTFLHFWLSERQDVQEPTALWGSTTNPNTGATFVLPMPQDAYATTGPSSGVTLTTIPTLSLKGDRRLITLFSRNGLLTTHTLENFDVGNTNYPFLESQSGAPETR
jgi:hypothetical protein